MNQTVPVINFSGDYDETIVQLAKLLGTDSIRRKVFEVIYGRGSKPRSIIQIMTAAHLPTRDKQQVRNSLAFLAKHDLIFKTNNDGSVKDGSRHLYRGHQAIGANKKKIIRFADDKRAADNVATKRRPAVKVLATTKVITKSELRRKKALNVLYLTSNPTIDRLRLDAEVSMVQNEIRGSKYRDNVHILHRPAANMKALLDGLNDHRPQIVHFSGHGNESGILADNASVTRPASRIVSFELLAKALNATDTPPDVIVLNACKSGKARRAFCPPCKIAVVMRENVSDLAAATFATRFYSAIAGGQSVKAAFDQGAALLEDACVSEKNTPELIYSSDTDPAKLILA